MQLTHGAHLAYCTNVHPGENWKETFDSLENYALAVRDCICSDQPFAIGLRLSDEASRELVDPPTLHKFRQWLVENNCYVFTINGFPFGRFHGARVKEQVFVPDWSSSARLDYTKRLFDILAALLPDGLEGSVSTLPGSFKGFGQSRIQRETIIDNFWRCIDYVAELSERTGHSLHLGVEPEPMGLFENTEETLAFFADMASRNPGDSRLQSHLGVNYDACHFAIQYESASDSLDAFARHNVRISKIHLSSALRVVPNASNLDTLRMFSEDIYLHQVIARTPGEPLRRYVDLPVALEEHQPADEWRIHFHIPLNARPIAGLDTTIDQVLGVLDWLAMNPLSCRHLEMETYTWAVLPPELKSASVTDQLVREYEWILPQLASRGLR